MRNVFLGLIFISLVACNHKIDKESATLVKLAIDTISYQAYSNDTLDSLKIHRLMIANSLLDSAIKKDSKNINAYYWKSTFKMQLKDYKSAMEICDKGIDISNGQKSNMLACLHLQRGLLNTKLNDKDLNNDFSAALDWYDSQIKSDESNIEAIGNKALILCYMDKKDEAIEYLTTIHNEKIESMIKDLIIKIKDFKTETVINKL